jgi:hypothetical protein
MEALRSQKQFKLQSEPTVRLYVVEDKNLRIPHRFVDVRTLIGSEGQGKSAEAFGYESFSSRELRWSENVASPKTRLADSPVNAAIFEIGWGEARPDVLTPD